MSPDVQAFTVHDATDFPIIRSRTEAIMPGYAARWESEMNALLVLGIPFVVIFPGEASKETPEDRKHRGMWLKRNKQALRRLCLSMIIIAPDDLKRVALRAQMAMAAKAFGIPMAIACSFEEAYASAKRLIATADAIR